jgi:hypothetical protein
MVGQKLCFCFDVQGLLDPWTLKLKKGLAIWHHSEFNYILNLYILSMCFVRYRNWIVCTVYNAAPMLFFILRKF